MGLLATPLDLVKCHWIRKKGHSYPPINHNFITNLQCFFFKRQVSKWSMRVHKVFQILKSATTVKCDLIFCRGKGANIWVKLYYSSSAASDMKYVQSCTMLLLDGSPCRLLLERNGEPRLACGTSSLLVTPCSIRAGLSPWALSLQRSSSKGMTFGLYMT